MNKNISSQFSKSHRRVNRAQCFRMHPLTAGIRATLAGLLVVGSGLVGQAGAADLPVVLRDQTGKAVRFEGANLPGVPYANQYGGHSLRIEQTADRAILHWDSFDIGKDNEVIFDQPRKSAIALNRVLGEADLPSVINGHLIANGRVFLINQNGILFGPDARVNTRSFVASTLDIEDELFRDVGYENAIFESQNNDLPAFTSDGQPMGEIRLEDGSVIKTDKNGRVLIFAPSITNDGTIEAPEGQIVLAASQDEVYIAPAGDDDDLRGLLVAVKTGGDVNNLGSAIAERGNVSMIGMAVNQNGMARATTSVALNGSVHLIAQDMNGSPTSNNFVGDQENGIQFVGSRGGEVNLGGGSVTEVVPADDATTAPDTQAQSLSTVKIKGERITFESGSTTTVPGGKVSIEANPTPLDATVFTRPGDPANSTAEVLVEKGAVIDVSGNDETEVSVARNYIEAEARGNELADAPLQRDGSIYKKTLTVDIRKGTGFLNLDTSTAIERDVRERLSVGGSVDIKSAGRIDIKDGAAVDISGGQVTYTGATVNSSKLVTVDGRVFDISEADPNFDYLGVLGDLEINHEKWGMTERFQTARGIYEPGYVEGKDAGALTLNAPGLAFDGDLIANTTTGRYQRRKPEDFSANPSLGLSRAYDQIPQGGKLAIRKLNKNLQDLVIGNGDTTTQSLNSHPVAADDAFVIAPELLASSGISRIDIDNAGRIIINGDLDLPAFSDVEMLGTQVLVDSDLRAAGGRVAIESLESGNSDADWGRLGSRSPILGALGLGESETSAVAIDGTIDVSGLWTNDSQAVNPDIPTAPIVTDGGSIEVRSGRDILLGSNSLLDVSGGAYLEADGRLNKGRGGRIDLKSRIGVGPNIPSRLQAEGELRGFGMGGGGTLSMQAGIIRIQPPGQTLSPDFALSGIDHFSFSDNASDIQSILNVDAGVFGLGGFSDYEFTAVRGGLEVVPGTRIQLTAADPLLDPAGIQGVLQQNFASGLSGLGINPMARSNGHPAEHVPTGTPIESFTRNQILPAYNRSPVDLTLASTATGELGGAVKVGANASVAGEPGATIRLASATNITVEGNISAPAGYIDLFLDGSRGPAGIDDRIWLGSTARLDASGAVRIDPVNNYNKRLGEVMDAGTVSIQAKHGSLFGQAGASINVDGVAGELDLGPDGQSGTRNIGGDAGDILLSAAESLVYSGDLSGRAVLDQEGGSLSVVLDPNTRGAPSPDPTISNDPFHRGETVAVMQDFHGTLPELNESLPTALVGKGFVPVGQVSAGGFDTLNVTVRSPAANGISPDTPDAVPAIEFADSLNLNLARRIALDAAVIRTTGPNAVDLGAPLMVLGSTNAAFKYDNSVPETRYAPDGSLMNNTQALNLEPTAGEGQLRIRGDLVEIAGELVTQGFGTTGQRLQGDGSLSGAAGVDLAAQQDIRLRGIRALNSNEYTGLFRTAGDLRLQAGRIYPTTLTDFEISVQGNGGSIEIAGVENATTDMPLSLGGAIEFNAGRIRQGGNVYAPLGELRLSADDRLALTGESLTSTSAFGLEVPFFNTQPGGALVFENPVANNNVDIIFTESPGEGYEQPLPQQRMVLKSPDIDVMPGASFDLRGGTDARATEFLPGPGGSRDILLADLDTSTSGVTSNPAFAIVPTAGEYAPYDPQETPLSQLAQDYEPGDTLILEEGIEGLPAGEYAILPPRYALFGGYLVTPVEGTQDLVLDTGLQRGDGAPILTGRYGVAGNNRQDSRTQGFAIENGATVRTRAEYRETALADLYSGENMRRPQDAGTLTVEARDALRLAGRLRQGGATDGEGSQVDILADDISILPHANGGNGIELLAAQLEGLGADSLLIGASRQRSADGLVISPDASRIEVAAGVDLDVPELILVGDTVEVYADAAAGETTRLGSSEPATDETQKLLIAGDPSAGVNGDAAVVAVSNRRLSVERSAPTGAATGDLAIDAGATLGANGSVVADVAGNARIAGEIDAEGALVNLGASSISLGETETRPISSGLILSNATLSGLAGSDLRLRTDTTIDIYGDLLNAATGGDIRFQGLTLDSQGIRGLANAGRTVRLTGDRIQLVNNAGSELAASGLTPAGGKLVLAADRLNLGDGIFTIQGYSDVAAQIGSGVLADGKGGLRVEAPFTLVAPVISGAHGAETTISAIGAGLKVTGGDADAALPAGTGLAAQLKLAGTSVDFGSRAVLPSGWFEINADGGVTLADGAVIDTSGLTLDFGPEQVGTPGGVIRLASATGDIHVGAALFDVSPSAVEGEAGKVIMESAQGLASIAGDARFVSGSPERGGEFTLQADRLEVAGVSTDAAYTALNRLLGGGFAARRQVRLHSQSLLLEQGETVRAHEVRAISDTGSITVGGTIDASALAHNSVYENGGTILLAAGDAIDIDSTAVLRANGVKGGTVEFSALDADASDVYTPGDAVSALQDRVNLASGAVIDVSGGSNPVAEPGARIVQADRELGGEVRIHTRWVDADGDGNLDSLVRGDLDATIKGAWKSELVATRRIDLAGGTITDADIETWRQQTATYLANTADNIDGFAVVPHLDVRRTGDITLQTDWDFHGAFADGGWHFANDDGSAVAGYFSLHATNDLILKGDITDAFYLQQRNPPLVSHIFDVLDDAAESWSYNLVAGSDSGSADPYATLTGVGDVRLAIESGDIQQRLNDAVGQTDIIDPNTKTFAFPPFFPADTDLEPSDLAFLGEFDVMVRTGTGDIAVHAGRDVKLESHEFTASDGTVLKSTGSIYTAGLDRGLSQNIKDVWPGDSNLTTEDYFNLWMGGGGNFPVDGGNVRVRAGGSVIAQGQVTPTDWQPRVGEAVPGAPSDASSLAGRAGAIPTHWGLAFQRFTNGIGALGGGELDVSTGGDLKNITLAIPTTGRTIAGAVNDTTNPAEFGVALETTEIAGGGQLSVDVGGDITDGVIYMGDGNAHIKVTGAATLGDAAKATRIYAGGSSDVQITAGDEVRVGRIQDPMMVEVSDSQGDIDQLISSVFGRNPATSLDNEFFSYTRTTSVDVRSLAGQLDIAGTGSRAATLPPQLRAVSLSQDLVLHEDAYQYPSPQGRIALLAGKDLVAVTPSTFSASARLVLDQSDEDATLLPNIDRPDLPDNIDVIVPEHAEVPVHLNDGTPNLVVAREGSIRPVGSSFFELRMAKLTHVEAGTDIVNLSAKVQNNRATDVSSFIAGRDIRQLTQRESDGSFKVPANNVDNPGDVSQFEIAGPGVAEFLAGRSIELGTSDGIETRGNIDNRFLPDGGARLITMAGLGGPLAYDQFIQTYLADGYDTGEQGGVVDYRDQLQSYLDAQGIAIQGNDPVATFAALEPRKQRPFLTGVLFSELKASGTYAQSNELGDYARGFDAINTLFPQHDPDGGISMLLSQVQTLDGGSIDMLVPGGDINAGAASATIIDKAAKDLGIVAAKDGDISIFMDGDLLVNATRVFALQGDLLIWSSNGSIDAGKGAKTVSSIPAPITRIGATGETVIEFPPAVEGSGLQGVNAFLFAPRGVINAGDAGIRATGDLTIGATEVIGADNIDVGGVSVGVPVANTGVGASFAGASNVASSTSKLAEDTTSSIGGGGDDAANSNGSVGILSVKVIGFGDCPADDPTCN